MGDALIHTLCVFNDVFLIALLHLHRWFFMQAIRERHEDPLDHPYSFSVRTVYVDAFFHGAYLICSISSYQSASAILSGLGTTYNHHPVIVSRCKTAWASAFSAAVSLCYMPNVCTSDLVFQLTMGTLVVYAPTIPLARPAMIEFERACTLFQITGQSSVQPENAAVRQLEYLRSVTLTHFQPILVDLLAVAKRAREQGRPQTTTPDSSGAFDDANRSSHSPISVSSHQSWTPAPSNGSSSHDYRTSSLHYDGIEEDLPDQMQYKREYEPAEVRESIRQWWDSAAREY